MAPGSYPGPFGRRCVRSAFLGARLRLLATNAGRGPRNGTGSSFSGTGSARRDVDAVSDGNELEPPNQLRRRPRQLGAASGEPWPDSSRRATSASSANTAFKRAGWDAAFSRVKHRRLFENEQRTSPTSAMRRNNHQSGGSRSGSCNCQTWLITPVATAEDIKSRAPQVIRRPVPCDVCHPQPLRQLGVELASCLSVKPNSIANKVCSCIVTTGRERYSP